MLTIVLIGLALYTALVVIVLGICAAASAGDRQVVEDDTGFYEPAAQRERFAVPV